jgi:TonB family protein
MSTPAARPAPLARPAVVGAVVSAAAVAAVLSLATLRLLAQSQPASLTGSIYDPTGGVLPQVEVTLEDAQHRTTRATTDASGRFRFAPVAPGSYTVQASLMGFKSVQQELVLRAASNWEQPITMQVGTLQETISVSAPRMPVAGAATRAASGPVRIGGNIRVPVKLVHVSPVYPPAMRDAGIEGVVPMEALIGRDGTVTSTRVASALVHPELAKSALDAVQQWKFSATLLNGEPVEVVMTVLVRFSLTN